MISWSYYWLTNKDSMATNKSKIVVYVQPEIKTKLETLADLRFRKVSNLAEKLLVELVREAEESGELPPGK